MKIYLCLFTILFLITTKAQNLTDDKKIMNFENETVAYSRVTGEVEVLRGGEFQKVQCQFAPRLSDESVSLTVDTTFSTASGFLLIGSPEKACIVNPTNLNVQFGDIGDFRISFVQWIGYYQIPQTPYFFSFFTFMPDDNQGYVWSDFSNLPEACLIRVKRVVTNVLQNQNKMNAGFYSDAMTLVKKHLTQVPCAPTLRD